MKTFCGILFLALILAASTAFACYQAYVFGFQAAFYAKTRSWKEANATVISLRVTTSSGSNGQTYHHCHVRYNYTVNGSTYNGSRASIYDMTGSLNLCNRLEKKRGLNKIKCLYNPSAPQESTLSRRFRVVLISLCLVSFFLRSPFRLWRTSFCLHSCCFGLTQPRNSASSSVSCSTLLCLPL